VPDRLVARDVSVTLDDRRLVSGFSIELGPRDRALVTADRSDSLSGLAYALAGLVPSPWRRTVEAVDWSRDWVQFEHRVLAARLQADELRIPRRTLLVPEDLDTWFIAGTGIDELAFFGWREREDAALDSRLFDLFDRALLSRPIYNLSGGEKQRLALAVALVAKPDAIILLNSLGWLDRDHRGAAIETLLSFRVPLVFCDDHVELLSEVCTCHVHLDGEGRSRVEPRLPEATRPEWPGVARTARVPDSPLVRASRLSFVHPGFDDVRVLDEATFTIPAVQNGFIVGPNGTGKSTLANLVCGLEARYSGDLTVFDPVGGQTSPRLLRDRLGVTAPQLLFQFVDDNLVRPRVGDYLALGVDEGRLRARDDALGWLEGLEAGPERLTSGLDTFQKKAVVLARMAITKCRLVFLDEPAWGVTRAERGHLHQAIARFLGDATKLWITHEPESVPYEPDVVIRIEGGKVLVGA
jgi:energy-coupling factor transporter ATP-binding protein EcfA2